MKYKQICFNMVVLGLLGFSLGCTNAANNQVVVKQETPSFRLANGQPLSLPRADEYNPVLLDARNGNVYLLFASNRSGSHNIYFTKNVSGTTYTTPRQLPAFEEPQSINPNSTTINSPTPISFAALIDINNDILIFFKTDSQVIKYFSYYTMHSNTSYANAINNTTRYNDTIVGATSYYLLGRDANGNIWSFDPDVNNTYDLTIPHLQGAQSVTRFDIHSVGHENAFLYLKNNQAALSGEPLLSFTPQWTFGNTVYYGSHNDLNQSLARSRLTPHDVYTANFGYSALEKNIILLSAHNGKSLDLYAITSHSPAEIWGMVAPVIYVPVP